MRAVVFRAVGSERVCIDYVGAGRQVVGMDGADVIRSGDVPVLRDLSGLESLCLQLRSHAPIKEQEPVMGEKSVTCRIRGHGSDYITYGKGSSFGGVPQFGLMCYNGDIMNEERLMFAEMLGIRKQAPEKPVQVVRPVSRQRVDPVDMVDELDVQREVVEEMALEKAQIEEERAALEAEKLRLELEKKELEGRVAALEADFAELKKELDSARAGNDELEEKLSRMGRSLAAARRAAAESSARRVQGGRP